MEIYDLFYKWVPVYFRIPVLILLFFVILCANGVFLGNLTDMASSLGMYPEHYTAAVNAMYIGMALGLMTEVRLKLRFSSKTLLLAGLSIMLLMNIVCATTSNPWITIIAVFILGFAKISALIEVYIIQLMLWSKQLDTSRFYPFVYFVALGGLYLTTWGTASLAYYYNWQYAYILVVMVLLIAILLTVLLVENHPLKKTMTISGMDWSSLLLLGISMLMLNYIVVYGKVEDWFYSDSIKLAAFGFIFSFLIFLKRTLTIPAPFLKLEIFLKPTFRIGLLLFFILGVFSTGTFQSAFSAGILQYDTPTNMQLNLFLIPGVTAASVICFIWYYKKLDPEPMIIIGFAGFLVYHIMMYQSFSNEFAITDFWAPSIVKGFATCAIYIAVGLYTTKNFDLGVVMMAGGVMILVRSFLGSGIFSGVYNYILYAERVRHLDKLAVMTDSGGLFPNQLTSSGLYKALAEQSTLAASKEVTGYIIVFGFALIVVLILYYIKIKIIGTTPVIPEPPLAK
jgi:DHA2 family multidrug resistance protein